MAEVAVGVDCWGPGRARVGRGSPRGGGRRSASPARTPTCRRGGARPAGCWPRRCRCGPGPAAAARLLGAGPGPGRPARSGRRCRRRGRSRAAGCRPAAPRDPGRGPDTPAAGGTRRCACRCPPRPAWHRCAPAPRWRPRPRSAAQHPGGRRLPTRERGRGLWRPAAGPARQGRLPIRSTTRQAVGVEATGPNSSGWSRKAARSERQSPPSASMTARSRSTAASRWRRRPPGPVPAKRLGQFEPVGQLPQQRRPGMADHPGPVGGDFEPARRVGSLHPQGALLELGLRPSHSRILPAQRAPCVTQQHPPPTPHEKPRLRVARLPSL